MGPLTENFKRRQNEDRLSQLPDELIINILSRLTLQESGRTSVLSRRWEKLWLLTSHCSGPNLIFRTLRTFESGATKVSHRKTKRLLYVGLLNKVFESHQHPLLDELVINLYLTWEFSPAIDNWIKFAFAKGVQRLELNLCYGPSRPYAFPIMHKFGFWRINRLRVVRLMGVHIDQLVVDSLFSSCPLLDSLYLKPWELGNLKISSYNLKDLELSGCKSSKSRIEISAPNMVKFGYEGCTRALHLECAPCLSQVYLFDVDSKPFFTRTDMHQFSYISQLKKLKLHLSTVAFMNFPSYPLVLPELPKLEEFEVKIMGFEGDSFLWPIVFIKASPFLHRFSVLIKVSISKYPAAGHSEAAKRRIKEAVSFRHRSLKVVEMLGFGGWSSEIELVEHLIDIGAQSLEKMVVDTRSPIRRPPDGPEGTQKLAQKLGFGLDSNVDFVIL